MVIRILCDIVLFASLFFLAWHWTAILAVIFIIIFPNFFEGIAAAFIFDFINSVPNAVFTGRLGIITALALILFFAANILRKRLRIFEHL